MKKNDRKNDKKSLVLATQTVRQLKTDADLQLVAAGGVCTYSGGRCCLG
jgi:hypothetical protein